MQVKPFVILVGAFLSVSVFAQALPAAKLVATPACSSNDALKWYRDSAERNAIYREVFLLAENEIRSKVSSQHLAPHHWGIVLDIDETTLDNSLWNMQNCAGQSESWNQFAAKAESIPTPGVTVFLAHIHALGGYVNLVSNRSLALQAATLKNLREQGVYYDQVLLDSTGQSSPLTDKNPRFKAIINGTAPSQLPKQTIVAWFGDNVQDFPKLQQKTMIQQSPNAKAYNPFGVEYFMLPNPLYGSWEGNALR